MQHANSNFISIQLGSGATRATFLLDMGKLCYAYFKPETEQQTAKLVLDFGASQKIFEKQDAEQVYLALSRYTSSQV
ncbi:hypothetical protein [Pontibacter amylolyticus]|uniref:Uncharacterized protein n=1 Tax=Pontibacter amylolyticus TaxID=1424080 RepID=A0ABQ1WA83_9BACT|nr:hypothetical protein [Pontibacter amylolyticus]GGG20645.1 hypothetical protein GCM10011323_25820 [Pontibacter amylolyticus]